MGKTTITKEQAEKLMKAATRDAEQTSHHGDLRNMISVNLSEARAILAKPSAGESAMERLLGDAFIRLTDDKQKIHLDHTVLSNIAGQGLAR